MPLIEVWGQASQKLIATFKIPPQALSQTLMDFLRSHQIPIASSCLGQGECLRCLINENILSCQILVKDFIEERKITRVSVSYL